MTLPVPLSSSIPFLNDVANGCYRSRHHVLLNMENFGAPRRTRTFNTSGLSRLPLPLGYWRKRIRDTYGIEPLPYRGKRGLEPLRAVALTTNGHIAKNGALGENRTPTGCLRNSRTTTILLGHEMVLPHGIEP